MARLTGIEPLSVRSLPDYDLLLAAAGYESRARHFCERVSPLARKRIACAFGERQVGSFDSNMEWFGKAGFTVESVSESDIEAWTSQTVEGTTSGEGRDREVRMCVDISSISRLRLACVLAAVSRAKSDTGVAVDFVYSIADWSPPPASPEPIVTAGAVLPFFAGWSRDPRLSTSSIIGLGYEPDKAVGSYEFLEASDVWIFVPVSDDQRYKRDVLRANASLLERVPERRVIYYRVDQPVACFGLIESVVYGSLSQSRPVLLPFGPKVFALSCMLVACLHRDVPVWRISSGQAGEAVDRAASGKIVGMRAVFSPEKQRL